MLSWSNSLASIASLNTWLQISGILFIIIAACCAYLLFSNLKKTIQTLSENASSSRNTKQSILDTAESIRKEMLQVKQDNDIAKMRITSLESDNKTLRLKLIKAEKANEQLEGRIKRIKDHQAEAAITMEPVSTESVTSGQMEVLHQALKSGPKGSLDIFSVIGQKGSRMLAEKLGEMLSSNGWTIAGVSESSYSKIPEGIVIAVHSKETAPSYVSFLQRALSSAGFPVSAMVNKKYLEWSLTLIVGRIHEEG